MQSWRRQYFLSFPRLGFSLDMDKLSLFDIVLDTINFEIAKTRLTGSPRSTTLPRYILHGIDVQQGENGRGSDVSLALQRYG